MGRNDFVGLTNFDFLYIDLHLELAVIKLSFLVTSEL